MSTSDSRHETQSEESLEKTAAGRRQLRLTVGLVILAVLAAVAFARWWFGWGAPRPGPPAPLSTAPVSELDADAIRQEALAVGDRVVAAFPKNADAVYSKALIHRRLGNRDAAVECWQTCLDLDPDFALARYCLGWDALERGEYEEAVDSLRKAIDADDDIDHALFLLGQALVKLDRHDEAVEPLEEYTRRAPASALGYVALGRARLEQDEPQKAKESFLRALEVDPDNPYAQKGLAAVESGSAFADEPPGESPDPAAEGLDRLEPPAGEDRESLRKAAAFAHTDAGRVFFAFGSQAEAERHWLRAAELDPKAVECRELLVTAYGALGRVDQALAMLGQLCEIQPQNVIHFNNLGAMNYQLRRFDAACEAYRKVQELSPRSYQGYAAEAEVLMKSDRDDKRALELARKAVEMAPIADNYYLLGVALARNGDRSGGMENLQKAIDLDSVNPDYREAFEDLKATPPAEKKPPQDDAE